MFVQIEETPNPETLKFLPGRAVMESGTAEFSDVEDAQRSPLASALFATQGVEGVFFGADFISVTKGASYEWSSLKPLVLGRIVDYFAIHETVTVKITKEENLETEELDSISREIRELIDSRVRPAVAMDGGDITFDRFENGTAYLKLKGACSGCPSSSVTLKNGIESMLKYYIPEVKAVEASGDTESPSPQHPGLSI